MLYELISSICTHILEFSCPFFYSTRMKRHQPSTLQWFSSFIYCSQTFCSQFTTFSTIKWKKKNSYKRILVTGCVHILESHYSLGNTPSNNERMRKESEQKNWEMSTRIPTIQLFLPWTKVEKNSIFKMIQNLKSKCEKKHSWFTSFGIRIFLIHSFMAFEITFFFSFSLSSLRMEPECKSVCWFSIENNFSLNRLNGCHVPLITHHKYCKRAFFFSFPLLPFSPFSQAGSFFLFSRFFISRRTLTTCTTTL